MGKFGGREINYHSDLDLVFLYEADGGTFHARRSRRGETTTNQHFFSELGQRIIKAASQLGRTAGCTKSIRGSARPARAARWQRRWPSSRATSPRGGQLWERQALCKARVVLRLARRGRAGRRGRLARGGLYDHPWQAEDADAIGRCGSAWRKPPRRAISSAGPAASSISSSWCRCCSSSTADPPRVAQSPARSTPWLHWRRGHSCRETIASSSPRAIASCGTIEARLRLMNTTARDDLPDDPRSQAGRPAGLQKRTGPACRLPALHNRKPPPLRSFFRARRGVTVV